MYQVHSPLASPGFASHVPVSEPMACMSVLPAVFGACKCHSTAHSLRLCDACMAFTDILHSSYGDRYKYNRKLLYRSKTKS